MATGTKIADILEPAVWLKYSQEHLPEKLDLLASSAVSSSLPPEVGAQMSAGGTIIDMPFWQDTDRSEPNLVSDDDTVTAPNLKITASKEKARKIFAHKSWGQSALAGIFATGSGHDPLKSLAGFTERYWRRIAQLYIIKVLDGVLADNVANDSADMRYSVYSDIATPLAANKISPAALTAVRLTMGEFMDDLGTIVMHSKVFGDALNQEAISFVQPSHLPFKIAQFAGMQVIVSDDVTVVSGTNSPKYRSYVFGQGAIAYTQQAPTDTPAIETKWEPGLANGGGFEVLHTRRNMLFHPRGFQFTSSSVAAKSPTWAELATAANWDRKMARKNCKFAYLETN